MDIHIPLWVLKLIALAFGTGLIYVLLKSLLDDYIAKKLAYTNDQIKRLWTVVDDFYELRDQLEDTPYVTKADLDTAIHLRSYND